MCELSIEKRIEDWIAFIPLECFLGNILYNCCAEVKFY